MKALALSALCLLPLAGCVASQASQDPPKTISDYLSFTGHSNGDQVVFAIDFIRSEDPKDDVADVEVTLHDEAQGWVELDGTGFYERKQGSGATALQGSPHFLIERDPARGLQLLSPDNGVTLTAEPIASYLKIDSETGLHALASAQAELRWQGRVFQGRLVHDRLTTRTATGFARLVSGQTLQGIHRFHVQVGHSRDFFAFGRSGEHGVEHVVGIEMANNAGERLMLTSPVRQTSESSLGQYIWPQTLGTTWRGEHGLASLNLRVMDHNQQPSIWLPGAHSTGVVSGLLTYGDTALPVYGLDDVYY